MRQQGISGNNSDESMRLYNVKNSLRAELQDDGIARYKTLYAKHGAGRTNLAYGYVRKAV